MNWAKYQYDYRRWVRRRVPREIDHVLTMIDQAALKSIQRVFEQSGGELPMWKFVDSVINAGIYENQHVVAFVGGLVDLFNEISADASPSEPNPCGYVDKRRSEFTTNLELTSKLAQRDNVVRWCDLIDYFIELPNISGQQANRFTQRMSTFGSQDRCELKQCNFIDRSRHDGAVRGCYYFQSTDAVATIELEFKHNNIILI